MNAQMSKTKELSHYFICVNLCPMSEFKYNAIV